MAEVLVFKANHERFGGERTYGWLLGTDFTFEIAPTSHPDSNYIDDDGQVGYAGIEPNLFATQSRYDEPESFIDSMRLVVSSGDGFSYQLTDTTGTDLFSPAAFSSFGGGALFFAFSERADTSIAGGEALMHTDGVSAPRLLIDEPVSTYWNLGDEVWARESWGPSRTKDVDLYRITPDLDVTKALDWNETTNDIEAIEVFEVGGTVIQYAWAGNEQEFFRYDADSGTWANLEIVVFRAVFAGSTAERLYYWDDRRVNDESRGIELWASDGVAGTYLTRDIFPGEGSGYPGDDLALRTAALGNRFFFYARTDSDDGAELFVTDGTTAGTVQLTGTGLPSGPLDGYNLNWDIQVLDDSRVLIVANGASGTELYVSDGTPEGTGLVADITPGEDGSFPVILETYDGIGYFTIASGENDDLIWVTDGTSDGTFALNDLRESGNGIRPAMAEVLQLDLANLPYRPFEGDADDNVLRGDVTRDLLSGLDGNDVLDGQAGDDRLLGGDGLDTLIGGAGDDQLFGGETEADLRDVIYGGDGNDSADGGYGNDELRGDAGNDTLAGGFGTDTLIGGAGDDVVTGSAFSDLVFGGDGNDFVNGGFGYDRINGGSGADRFFHLGIADHGSDWVQDYNAAEGDVLVFGGAATADQFQINLAHTQTPDGERSGEDGVQEAFVIYRPTGQIIWALVDGDGQEAINLQVGGEVFDLLA
ncbi:hypothetical protein ACFORG_02335 [Lutimaribacter marinistellae]|uniref:Hemolysin-type calcium-binding repeat-containing protein n=1 Tax=Lutimaribacter marinistellae TaxID=1820329 RepID=A0ABV7TAF1_9RHOB